jgi:hypothetical protein
MTYPTKRDPLIILGSKREKGIWYYEVRIGAGNLSSGICFYRLHAGNFTDTKKVVLLK